MPLYHTGEDGRQEDVVEAVYGELKDALCELMDETGLTEWFLQKKADLLVPVYKASRLVWVYALPKF